MSSSVKKSGAPCGTVEDADLPIDGQLRKFAGAERQRCGDMLAADMQHVAGLAARRSHGRRTRRARRSSASRDRTAPSNAAAHRQIGALPGPAMRPSDEHLPGLDVNGLPIGDRRSIERGGHDRARPGRSSRRNRSAASGPVSVISSAAALSALPTMRLARRCERSSIGPRRRNADIPIAEPARPILQARLRAGREHLDRCAA